jgi:hypothetical protein
MDYRHSYAGDKIWRHTKGIDLKNLKADLLGEGREEMFGRTRPRRENGFLLTPERMAQVQTKYQMLNYKYNYSVGGIYAASLFCAFKLTNMKILGKLLIPHLITFYGYKYLRK